MMNPSPASQLALLFLMCMLSPPNPAHAVEKHIYLGLGADVVLPLEDAYKAHYTSGFGGSLRFQQSLGMNVSAMVTVGYMTVPPKNDTLENELLIPVVGGIKGYVNRGKVRVYLGLDAGVNFSRTAATDFIWQPHVGIESRIGESTAFEVSGRYLGLRNAGSLGLRFGVLIGF